jgi:hypothetical protein
VSARLAASTAEGLTAGTAPPAALRVETLNPLVSVFDEVCFADLTEPLEPIRIVAARNGVFSGQIVVRGEEPISKLEARAGRLTSTRGTGRLPSSAISIRYARPTGAERGTAQRFGGKKGIRRFDALADEPAKAARTHVVWVTVRPPADTAAGEYRGELALRANDAKALRVPLHLGVSAWTLPDPRGFATHLGLIQSPETVALQYKVPLWSDEHFRLIGKSLDLLGQVGNDVAFVPLVCKTHFGNEQTMVRWIRRPDGRYEHDYTVFDRYLDLAIRKCGKPEVLCLYVWDYFLGGGYFGRKGKKPQGVTVSLLDPAGDKVTQMVGPVYGTAESEAFMKPVMDGVRKRLNKRGIADRQIMLGVAGDNRPSSQVTDLFAKIAPYARWLLHSHASAEDINGVPVGLFAHVWGTKPVPDPAKGRLYGWQGGGQIRSVFPRYGADTIGPMWSDSPLAVYWAMSEALSMAGYRGFGRVGADFWPVLKGPRGRGKSIAGRYPDGRWHQLSISASTLTVLEPGPSGAVSTVRFEAIRQGVQECEARIYIEKALTNDALRRRLPNALARRCRRILDDRTQRIRAVAATGKRQNGVVWQWYASTDWRGRAMALFDAAAAVAKALGG